MKRKARKRALEKIPLWTQADPKAPSAEYKILIRAIQLDDALLQLQKASFGPFDARVSIADTGLPERADITARDGRFKANFRPAGTAFNLELQARDWRLPAGPPILFEELLVKGVATMNDADLQDVKARLYGGSVSGKTRLDWRIGLQAQDDYSVNAVV